MNGDSGTNRDFGNMLNQKFLSPWTRVGRGVIGKKKKRRKKFGDYIEREY